jgi:predicted  nucleic acid-binding Zn-ribbon protein
VRDHNRRLEDELDALNLSVRTLTEENERLVAALRAKDMECLDLRDRVLGLEAELDALSVSLRSLRDENERLVAEL